MKKTFLILVLSIIFLGINCRSKAQSLSIPQVKFIESQVDATFHEMLALAEKFDYDKLSKGVDDKRKAGFIVNGKYYSDYSSLVENIKLRAQGVSNQSISISDKKITVLSDKIALLTTYGLSHVILDDGNEFNVKFYWSFVYERIGDTWKVVHSHQSRSK